ncbi:hypothetical protein RRG08_016626 [Elysia crispata]|uniref:Uncharacterized protein n=1 Tax=Elysia crispata TaxID=231223 RepID=A0AAE0ZMG2_9GAST|nr:hypothetical protein RRG08_016626 [Elysia crispata]
MSKKRGTQTETGKVTLESRRDESDRNRGRHARVSSEMSQKKQEGQIHGRDESYRNREASRQSHGEMSQTEAGGVTLEYAEMSQTETRG